MERSSRRKKPHALALELSLDHTSKSSMMSGRAAALKRLSERANNSSSSSSSSLSSAPPPFSSGSLVDPSSALSSPRKISFSFVELGQAIVAQLRSYGVRIDPGLSDEEIEIAQAAFQITFPPDLRGILQQGLPIGPGFPDWRSHLGSHKLKLWIAAPKTGLCSAAELGLFWWRGWGARPPEPGGAARAARAALRRVPVMVPVFGQCYVPSLPVRASNPVIFVDRSNAFYCAHDLSEFFAKDCFKRFVGGGSGGDGCAGGGGGGGSSYCPEPMIVQQQEPGVRVVGGVESARKMIARCVSNIGEDLEGLEAALAERRSSVSARSVLAGPRASSTSRSSDGSSDDHDPVPTHHHPSSLHRLGSSSRGVGIRRIEFWSDLVEKGTSMNCAAGRLARDDIDDGFVQLAGDTDLDWDERAGDQSNPWHLVQESVGEMAIKLRRAGWNERDVEEIIDSCEHLDHRCDDPRPNPADRESVIEGLAAHLDFLSSCLRDAGWSIHDISETLYSDLTGFSEHSGRGARISPEVASRIGVLAAFVAQG